MLEWITGRRRPAAHRRAEPVVNAARARAAEVCGKSAPLFKYLDERFADAVVLTFQEIEDLLGFPLPEAARLNEEWWTAADKNATPWTLADSWILAERTARPNMQARIVTFERAA
jgi:hypothetical protein